MHVVHDNKDPGSTSVKINKMSKIEALITDMRQLHASTGVSFFERQAATWQQWLSELSPEKRVELFGGDCNQDPKREQQKEPAQEFIETLLQSFSAEESACKFVVDGHHCRGEKVTCTMRSLPTAKEVTIDFPELVVRVTAPVGENKVGSSAGVHVRNGNGTPGRMLYGYHWDKEGMLGPYHDGHCDFY